jgi:hypothetical protein
MKAIPMPINWRPELSIYASEPFLKSVGDEYGWLGGFDQQDRLRCVLPYTVVRKAVFRMVRFRVDTIPLGGDLTVEEEKSFLNSVVEYFRASGADMIIPPSTNTIFRTYPDGAIAAPYGTYVINLSQPEEALLANFNSSHRRKVRLATKAGVQIRSGVENMETAYRLVRDTFKRSALGFMGHDAFKRMVLGLGENVKIFVAEHQGVVQGCTVIPFSGHSAYYVYGGSIPEPETGSMNLLHWEAIRLFRGLGVKRYDFVGVRINPEPGSKQEGLKMFKERFGGQLMQGYMWKYSFHPLKYLVYGLAVRLRRGGDIVDQEQPKMANQSDTDRKTKAVSEPIHHDQTPVEP